MAELCPHVMDEDSRLLWFEKARRRLISIHCDKPLITMAEAPQVTGDRVTAYQRANFLPSTVASAIAIPESVDLPQPDSASTTDTGVAPSLKRRKSSVSDTDSKSPKAGWSECLTFAHCPARANVNNSINCGRSCLSTQALFIFQR